MEKKPKMIGTFVAVYPKDVPAADWHKAIEAIKNFKGFATFQPLPEIKRTKNINK